MTCSNCARKVTEALQQVPGVDHASIRLQQSAATITWKAGTDPAPEVLVQAVVRAGFGAMIPDPETGVDGVAPRASAQDMWRFQVILGAVLTIPLMIGEWALGLGHTDWFQWVGFACAAPVVVVCGRSFFVGAWRQLRRGASNMDTLVSLGSSTAFLYSTAGLFLGWPGHLYFMEAAAIITLISAGHWMEALAGARAAGALRALMNLAPAKALKWVDDRREVEVPAASLRSGDLVVLKPGDRVPTDGEVSTGESSLDESMLTGESVPVEKRTGSKLYAGTLNQDGRLIMRVTATGETTALARIIAVVERAQNSRAHIQRLADRVSSVFVPIVVLVALGTAFLWALAPETARGFAAIFQPFLWKVHLPESALAAAVIHATAVLIVACPCAMGLATPAAIMAGANVAARRGILIRDGHALEKSGTLTAVAFDKTGTLTRGQLSVVAEVRFGDGEPGDSVAPVPAILALARSSHHPISQALSRWAAGAQADAEPLAVYGWQERRGQGIEAAWSGLTLRLGSPRWLADSGVEMEPGRLFLGEWTTSGATVVGLAADQTLIGLLAVRDELKPHAVEVVRTLRARGLKVFIITGDQRATAVAIARSAGIPESEVLAEVTPEQKAERIQELQRRGEKVAFVGDGINDAPALAQADLGVAVGRASDVARESADVILLNSDVQAIPEAILLSQATLRTIRQNLFWAFFYNVVMVPLAIFGIMHPVLAEIAMAAISINVVTNSKRLERTSLDVPDGRS